MRCTLVVTSLSLALLAVACTTDVESSDGFGNDLNDPETTGDGDGRWRW